MDATATKTETTSPSDDPTTVACPTCNAPIGGKCYEVIENTINYLNWYHLARVQAATAPVQESGTGQQQPASKPEPQSKPAKRTETVY